jgi:hypothetical protein
MLLNALPCRSWRCRPRRALRPTADWLKRLARRRAAHARDAAPWIVIRAHYDSVPFSGLTLASSSCAGRRPENGGALTFTLASRWASPGAPADAALRNQAVAPAAIERFLTARDRRLAYLGSSPRSPRSTVQAMFPTAAVACARPRPRGQAGAAALHAAPAWWATLAGMLLLYVGGLWFGMSIAVVISAARHGAAPLLAAATRGWQPRGASPPSSASLFVTFTFAVLMPHAHRLAGAAHRRAVAPLRRCVTGPVASSLPRASTTFVLGRGANIRSDRRMDGRRR